MGSTQDPRVQAPVNERSVREVPSLSRPNPAVDHLTEAEQYLSRIEQQNYSTQSDIRCCHRLLTYAIENQAAFTDEYLRESQKTHLYAHTIEMLRAQQEQMNENMLRLLNVSSAWERDRNRLNELNHGLKSRISELEDTVREHEVREKITYCTNTAQVDKENRAMIMQNYEELNTASNGDCSESSPRQVKGKELSDYENYNAVEETARALMIRGVSNPPLKAAKIEVIGQNQDSCNSLAASAPVWQDKVSQPKVRRAKKISKLRVEIPEN